jgi:hypothetical protein
MYARTERMAMMIAPTTMLQLFPREAVLAAALPCEIEQETDVAELTRLP